jgi:predicted RNA-binding Zn-ribbon protein involved in translation (DUF1610 family)
MIVCSTSVSSLVNVTLIVDLVRTRDFSNSGKQNIASALLPPTDVNARQRLDTKTAFTCPQCYGIAVLCRVRRCRPTLLDTRADVPRCSLFYRRYHGNNWYELDLFLDSSFH